MIKHNIILILLLVTGLSYGQTITSAGGWTVVVPTNIVIEAGSNYTTTTTTTSTSTASVLALTGLTPASSYTVTVHKVDINWNDLLILSLFRGAGTASGTGSTVSGGTTYMVISNTPQVFFIGTTGTGTSRTAINITYRYIGRTVLLPAQNYTTTVVYTLSN